MTIFTRKHLVRAYMQCLKHKKNLNKLLCDLQTGRYTISRHICFIITHPSPREIFAADFRDRIVHHLLCNEIQDIFEKDFSNNSYANRKNYGTHKAVKNVKWYMRRGGQNGKKLYYLKMDIKSFFRSIDKQILWNIVLKKIEQQDKPYWWKEEVLHLSKLIIFHNPARNYIFKGNLSTKNLIPTYKSLLNGDTTKGLPIGNLTSQFFANVYMNELDQYVEHVLKYDKYARYVDDFVMFDEDNEKLKRDMQNISLFCQGRLNLGMANHKTVLRNTYIGIDFLGYYIKSTHTLVRKKVVKRFKNKFFGVLDGDGFVGMGDIPMIKSYVGHFEHANSEGLKVKYRLV